MHRPRNHEADEHDGAIGSNLQLEVERLARGDAARAGSERHAPIRVSRAHLFLCIASADARLCAGEARQQRHEQ
jgi:hypothetical protein